MEQTENILAVKELCQLDTATCSRRRSEIAGFLLTRGVLNLRDKTLSVEVGLPAALKRIRNLLFDEFGLQSQVGWFQLDRLKKSRIFKLTFDYQPLNEFFKIVQSPLAEIESGLLADEQLQNDFLRGSFLACGRLNWGNNCYALNFYPGSFTSTELIIRIFDKRKISYRLYNYGRQKNSLISVRSSDDIVGLLAQLGALNSFLRLSHHKVVLDLRNTLTREVNCETANINRTVTAASELTDLILRAQSHSNYYKIAEPLRQAAEIRIKYPLLSIRELAEKFEPPKSKNSVSSILRRLKSKLEEILA